MLNEIATGNSSQEVLAGQEVVIDTVDLASTGVAGGVGDTESKLVGVLGKEALQEGGLAGAGGARDDNRSGRSCCRYDDGFIMVERGGKRIRV